MKRRHRTETVTVAMNGSWVRIFVGTEKNEKGIGKGNE